MIRYLLLALAACTVYPAHAQGNFPWSPEVVYAVQYLNRYDVAEARDKNGVLIAKVKIVREDRNCKGYKINDSNREWKACRDGRYWNMYDDAGTSTRVEIVNEGRKNGSCNLFSAHPTASPQHKLHGYGCPSRTNVWNVREEP